MQLFSGGAVEDCSLSFVKMSAQAESVIRNIIREITLECSAQGETISETLAAFIVSPQSREARPCCARYAQVKAAVLDPENEFNVERTLTKDDVKKLIGVGARYPAFYIHYNCIHFGLVRRVCQGFCSGILRPWTPPRCRFTST